MKVNYSHRGAGKTWRMIRLLRQKVNGPNRILITPNQNICMALRHGYPDVAHQIFTWNEIWLKNMRGKLEFRNKEIIIDNADIVLQQMFELPITHVSINKE